MRREKNVRLNLIHRNINDVINTRFYITNVQNCRRNSLHSRKSNSEQPSIYTSDTKNFCFPVSGRKLYALPVFELNYTGNR